MQKEPCYPSILGVVGGSDCRFLAVKGTLSRIIRKITVAIAEATKILAFHAGGMIVATSPRVYGAAAKAVSKLIAIEP